MERGGRAAGQCLWHGGDARPPHEQGAGALRFVSVGAVAEVDGGRPTSRGLPSAKACVGRRCLVPRGQGGRCQCAGATLFAPAGQKRCRVGAPDFGLSRERTVCGAVCLSTAVCPAHQKNGKCAAIHANRVSKTSQAASPCAWACRRLRAQPPQAERNAACLAPCSWGRQASTPSQRHWLPALPARRALPAPAQGINPLRIPFWGTGDSSVAPVPQNAAGGRPLLVGLPPSTSTTAPTGTKRSTPTPCSWGGCASASRRRHWPPALPA